MASYFSILKLKRFQSILFVCTLVLCLIYHFNKSEPEVKTWTPKSTPEWTPKQKDGIGFQKNSTAIRKSDYKLLNERDVFGDNVDANSSVQMKTFFNTTVHPPGVILRTKGGIGIGNQLFQYACSYALAKDLGWPLYVHLDLNSISSSGTFFQPDLREFALHKFQIHFENIIDKTTKFSAKERGQNDQTFLQRTFLDVPDPQNQFVKLEKYCQSIEYWKNYQDEIRAMFQPRKSSINFSKIQKVINQIRNSESVAVHVRRGDFEKISGYFMPISYQRYAMRKMISVLETRGKGKPVFFVFSDDIVHAEKKLKDFGNTYKIIFVAKEIANATSIEDLYLMTLCKHIIIPNSTFGWWAAYLIKNVDKIVIASAHNPIFYFSAVVGGQDKFFNTTYGRLYHPKEWIVIDPFTGGLAKGP